VLAASFGVSLCSGLFALRCLHRILRLIRRSAQSRIVEDDQGLSSSHAVSRAAPEPAGLRPSPARRQRASWTNPGRLDDAALRASADQAQDAVTAAQSEQAAAQTDAKLAASTLERYKQLQAEKSVSPQEMDEVARRAEASFRKT